MKNMFVLVELLSIIVSVISMILQKKSICTFRLVCIIFIVYYSCISTADLFIFIWAYMLKPIYLKTEQNKTTFKLI